MTISPSDVQSGLAQSVRVTDEALTVDLRDGRTIVVPTPWFPRLFHGTDAERSHWTLLGGGQGIHWPDLDEDISVESLLAGRPSGEAQASLAKWLATRPPAYSSPSGDGASETDQPDRVRERGPSQEAPTAEADSGALAPVALNPLRWFAAEPGLAATFRLSLTLESLFAFTAGVRHPPSLEDCAARYAELNEFDGALFAFPQAFQIQERVLAPLLAAKTDYVLGRFPQSIAMSGVTAEMLAVFRIDVAATQLGELGRSEERQRLLLGKPIKMLWQERRISVLLALGLISQDDHALFDEARDLRNKYLHILPPQDRDERKDARRMYEIAARLTQSVLGVQVGSDSKIHFHPDIQRIVLEEARKSKHRQ